MSQPQLKNYSVTVFIVEGKKAAFKVITEPAGRRVKNTRFESPEAALTWCRQNGACLVYTPEPSSN